MSKKGSLYITKKKKFTSKYLNQKVPMNFLFDCQINALKIKTATTTTKVAPNFLRLKKKKEALQWLIKKSMWIKCCDPDFPIFFFLKYNLKQLRKKKKHYRFSCKAARVLEPHFQDK